VGGGRKEEKYTRFERSRGVDFISQPANWKNIKITSGKQIDYYLPHETRSACCMWTGAIGTVSFKLYLGHPKDL